MSCRVYIRWVSCLRSLANRWGLPPGGTDEYAQRLVLDTCNDSDAKKSSRLIIFTCCNITLVITILIFRKPTISYHIRLLYNCMNDMFNWKHICILRISDMLQNLNCLQSQSATVSCLDRTVAFQFPIYSKIFKFSS